MKFCRGCATMRGAKAFGDDARTRDGKATLCTTCAENGRTFGDIDLEVVDVMGVEIMAAGEHVRGQGSPPGGERYAEDALQELADNTNAVINELRPFVKIGHSNEQRLAKASGLYDAAENPATGWAQKFRVDGDKLVTDLYAVPKKLAGLVKSRAFARVSPEMKIHDGKPVINAIALLGAKAPAFKTLNDIYALYQDDEDAPPVAQLIHDDEPADDDTMLIAYAAGDVVWDPEKGASDVMEDITRTLNPNPGNEMPSYRYWCCDVQLGADGGTALVRDNSAQDSSVAWVVPFTFDGEGEPVPASSADWTLAQQAWIERANDAAASYAEYVEKTAATENGGAPDTTSRTMGEDTKTKTDAELQAALDAQTKQFAEALGLPETATADEVAAAVKAAKDAKPAPSDDGTRQMNEAEYSELVTQAKAGARAFEEMRIERRDNLIKAATEDGRIAPAAVEQWTKRYDEAPEITKEILAELSPDPRFTTQRVIGADGTPQELSGFIAYSEDEERAYAEYCGHNGIPYLPLRRAQQDANADTQAVTP